MEKEQFNNSVVSYLKTVNPFFDGKGITDDTDLMAVGALDSFKIIEFVIFLENLAGVELPVDKFNFDSLRSMRSIYKMFNY